VAATVQGRRLTEAHRLAQARLGARTVARMRTLWPLLDPTNLDGSFDRWLSAAVPIVRAQRTSSARLAANYTTTLKTLETGVPAPIVLAESLPTAQVTTSLLVTGPYRLRSALARGVPLVRALSTAEATSASAAMRLALNGGRETIVEMVRADRDAVGWARAASGSACAFCATLASRGAVYREDTVDFQAHDHCSCNAEPIYRPDSALPAGSERYAQLYQEAKAAGGDTLANMRRLLAS